MSYTLYKTKAIIIGCENQKEANRWVTLVTDELGVIRATAQSVRVLRSKQRYGLQLFAFSEVSLVLGKAGWRVVGVSPIENFGFTVATHQAIYALLVRATALVRRLTPGEAENNALFKELLDALVFLTTETIEPETLQFFETLLILRVLHHLGYWESDMDAPWMVDAVLSQEILFRGVEHHSNLIRKINTSLRETQL